MKTLREIELIQSLERRDARILELERDAARYRWLRYNASFTIYSFLFGEPSMAHHAESDLDAAIDHQMEPQ